MAPKTRGELIDEVYVKALQEETAEALEVALFELEWIVRELEDAVRIDIEENVREWPLTPNGVRERVFNTILDEVQFKLDKESK